MSRRSLPYTPRRTKPSIAAAAFGVATLIAILAPGCASSGAVVTAAPGGTRTVRVGQTVLVTLPATTAAREWRLTKFDSATLPVQTPLVLQRSDRGDPQWVARFRAVAPGATTVEYTRLTVGPGGAGEAGEVKRFGFRIQQ